MRRVIKQLEQFNENTEVRGTSFVSMMREIADFKVGLPDLIADLKEMEEYIHELEQRLGVK